MPKLSARIRLFGLLLALPLAALAQTGTSNQNAQYDSVGTGTPPPCVAGTAGGDCASEGTAPTNASGAGIEYFDSTLHEKMAATNGSSSFGMLNRTAPGAIQSTGKTASVSTATLCAASAGACNVSGAQYEINLNVWGSGTACSSVTAGKVVFTLTWTDQGGTTHSAIPFSLYDQKSAAANVTGTFNFNTSLATEGAMGSMVITTNGTVIQYAATYTACTTGTGTYNYSLAATRLQ